MKKLKKINLDKILYILVLVIMIGIPVLKFMMYIPFIKNIDPYRVSRLRVYFFWISLLPSLFIYLYSVVSGERKITYIDYLIYFLIFTLFISSTFAIDFQKSIWGEDARYEGLLTLTNYYLLMLNAKNIKSKKYKNNIINCFIYLGVFQAFYSIYQSFTPFKFLNNKFSGGSHMAMGLCSNPNFFGAYMAMQLSIVTVYYIKEGSFKHLWKYILFSVALYLASSSGPVLGYVLSFILFGVLFRKQYKRILALVCVFLITCFITDKSLKFVHENLLNNNISDRYIISNDIANTVDKIQSDNIESIGSGRIGLWKRTLPLVKEYWLTGCGLDNFYYALPQTGKTSFDKAHNVYLQMAVTNGIFPTLVYMFICLIVFLKGFKLKKTYSFGLFMAFVSYCILAFANISVIDVAPYFYIIWGILISETERIKISRKINL